jgi:4-amino-4-deoxy-L-arabinose transferase-like glycosyltransferase
MFDMMKISSFNISVRNYLLLPIQVTIFAFAVLVRGSAVSLIGAIVLVWLVLAWQNRRNPRRFRLLVGKLAILVLVPVVLVGTIALLVPRDYLTQGRFGTVVWHRVFTSLGWNPAYPFPDVNEMFDCKRYIPEGIGPGISDRNGQCVWWDYTIRHHISENDTVYGTYGGRYETAAREAFFKIARRYPGEVLATFFYYKPPLILNSLRESIKIDMSAYPPLAIGLLVAALANLLVYFFSAAGRPTADTRRVAALALLCAAFSIPQLLVGWALPNTAADLFFFCIFCAGLAFGAAVTGIRAALRREPSVQAIT